MLFRRCCTKRQMALQLGDDGPLLLHAIYAGFARPSLDPDAL
jgi:hypothetical protein